MNKLITPYLPARYQLSSTDDFLQILRATTATGKLASIDVDSLFTSVLIHEITVIICRNAYHHASLSPPHINEPMLRKLLLACTCDGPSTHMDGKIYKQIDGVAKGSPLGVTFAHYYMCNLENKIFDRNSSLKSTIYCRYIDDCFVLFQSHEKQDLLVGAVRKNSVLNFIIEQNGSRSST